MVGDAQGASVLPAGDPSQSDEPGAQRRAKSAGEVRAALGPIDALSGEATAGTAELIDVDAEIGEPTAAVFAKFEVPRSGDAKNAGFLQGTRQCDGHAAGEVVVAGARKVQIARSGRTRGRGGARFAGNGAEGFESMSDVRPGQSVIAVPSGGTDRKQAAIEKLGEVAAGRLSRDVGREREFAGGAGTPIEQGDQNGGTRGVADEFS